MSLYELEDLKDAAERFHRDCVALIQSRQKRKLAKIWTSRWIQTRKGPTHCYICGKDMSQPGQYRAIENRKVCCTACYDGLPLCGQCGKGTSKQFCRECIGKK